MKKLLFALAAVASLSVYAAPPTLPDITKDDLKKVGNEFAVNFSHTVVAAPETDGLWGVEAGLVAGQTGTPKLKDLIDDAGEDGSDFKNAYHAAVFARGHLPYDIFLEASILPEREISDVEVSSSSFGAGWNLGAFMNWPLDLTFGASMSKNDVKFEQVINNASTGNTPVESEIKMKSSTQVAWVGVSKTFLFFTPYIKAGTAKSESDVSSSIGTIFAFTTSQKEKVKSTGGYLVVGANVNVFFLKLGVEAQQMIDVKRVSGKISLDF